MCTMRNDLSCSDKVASGIKRQITQAEFDKLKTIIVHIIMLQVKFRRWSSGWERKSQHCFCDRRKSKRAHEINVVFASGRRFPNRYVPANATPI